MRDTGGGFYMGRGGEAGGRGGLGRDSEEAREEDGVIRLGGLDGYGGGICVDGVDGSGASAVYIASPADPDPTQAFSGRNSPPSLRAPCGMHQRAPSDRTSSSQHGNPPELCCYLPDAVSALSPGPSPAVLSDFGV